MWMKRKRLNSYFIYNMKPLEVATTKEQVHVLCMSRHFSNELIIQRMTDYAINNKYKVVLLFTFPSYAIKGFM